MNAFEIPGLRFSLPAGGAVERARFISVDTDGAGKQADATSPVIGASMNKTNAGEVLEIADGIVMVTASAAIDAGAGVKSDANGKAVTASTGAIGVAITSATAADQLISVKL